MKRTTIMVITISTFLATWMLVALIGYLLSDITYKECMLHGGTWGFMLILGWIPAAFVCVDLNEYYYGED